MIKFLKALMQAIEFMLLPASKKKIVFYSEGKNYWPIFEGIVTELNDYYEGNVFYITSDCNDPGCKYINNNFITFIIDEGYIRNWLFSNIEASIVLMTMPDLNQYQVKRSINAVHYIYVQHALMSLHMAYRFGAFDWYDTIFCAGPHHVQEIRLIENKYNLRQKRVVEIGYERIDSLINLKSYIKFEQVNNKVSKHILIAPSWGVNCLIETSKATGLIEILLNLEYKVTFRPHPETIKSSPDLIEIIKKSYSQNNLFYFEDNISTLDSFINSDIMITKWSGSALEYALGLGKPILYLDLPKKIKNDKYKEIDIEPLEISIRNKIGVVSAIEDIDKSLISSLCSITIDPNEYVFNIGKSKKIAVKYILDTLKDLS